MADIRHQGAKVAFKSGTNSAQSNGGGRVSAAGKVQLLAVGALTVPSPF
jgi:hypothetical protein